MKPVFFLLLFFPLLGLSQINQTDANGLRQGLWQKTQPNGRLAYEGSFKDGKPVGEWKRYHEGGQIKALIIYIGDSAKTQLFDLWKKKVAEGTYLNERKVGLWRYFDENVKVSEENYVNGLKEGVSKKFYNTGELMEESQWKNNLQDGKYQAFYKDGKPYLQCKMVQGKRDGLFLTFFESGRPELEATYQKGLRHGDWKFFNEAGDLLYTLKYNQGELLNPEVRDSITNHQLVQMEKNKGKITDPEKYIQDPSEYLNKMNQKK